MIEKGLLRVEASFRLEIKEHLSLRRRASTKSRIKLKRLERLKPPSATTMAGLQAEAMTALLLRKDPLTRQRFDICFKHLLECFDISH